MIGEAMSNSGRAGAVKGTLALPELHQEWEKAFRTDQNEAFYEVAIDNLLRYLPPPEGLVLLDAGCGGGAHSVRLARRGFRVEAIDFSEHVLNSARERVALAGLAKAITVSQGDLTDLSIADDTFDCVFCWGVLMHVPDAERALDNLCRVTKPGGTLVIYEINMRSPEARASRLLARKFSKREVESRKSPAGIENWTVYASGPLMWRHANIEWLRSELQTNGFAHMRRLPGQFTEIYNGITPGRLTGAIHAYNRFWLTRVRSPYLAVSNLLVAKKL